MKRILALLLCFALCLSLLPASFAADIEIIDEATIIAADNHDVEIFAYGDCGDDVSWFLDVEGLLELSGSGPTWDFSDERPEFYQYTEITAFAEVKEGVTGLGSGLFYDIRYLETAQLPASLTVIGASAFGGCTALKEVFFRGPAPAVMAEDCFFGVSATVWYPDDEPSWTEDLRRDYGGQLTWKPYTLHPTIVASGSCGEDLNWTLDKEGTLTISGSGPMTEFADGTAPWLNGETGDNNTVKTLVIQEGATSIGSYAFCRCSSLSEVRFPESLTKIGVAAFGDCDALTAVTIPRHVTEIGAFAFYDCGAMTAIEVDEENPSFLDMDGVLFTKDAGTLLSCPAGKAGGYSVPEGVTVVGDGAFYGCVKMTSITLPDGVTVIGDGAFYVCSGMTSITLPEGLRSLGYSAFQGCHGLTGITLPNSLTSIGACCFYYCDHLTEITIPDGVSSLGEASFCYDSELTSVRLPAGLTTIGTRCFRGCNKLRDAALPDALTTISDEAFRYCYVLKDVTIPDAVTTIGDYAFYACNGVRTVTIGSGLTSIGDSAFRCSGLTDFVVDVDNQSFSDRDGVLYTKDGTTLICYPHGRSGDYEIPEGVKQIADSAFYQTSNLTGITFPDSVTTIGRFAFSSIGGLTSVTFGDGLTTLGEKAFSWCRNLTEIRFLGAAPTIATNCFSNVEAKVWYPVNDGSWTEDLRQNYGQGTLSWTPYVPMRPGADPASATLPVHDTLSFYTPAGNAVWAGSDENVATVDENGLVTAQHYGKCTISASTGGQIYSCELQTLFWDVADPSQYYFKHVYWAAEKGITKGYDLEYFDPQGECTREQMMTFLWRLAGQPDPTTSSSKFSDVKKGSYYYKAVLWGVEKGITNGYSSGPLAGKFGVGEACTREQAMTFLWRMAGKPNPTTTTNKFKDVKSGDYFYKAVLWASENKIANGYADGTYGVGLACLREHMVTFLSKYDAKFGNH